MAVAALTNCTTYVDGYDFTGDTNNALIQMEAAALDCSNFASGGWKQYAPGPKSVDFQYSGHWQSAATDAVDPQVFSNFAGTQVFTVAHSGTETSPAYLFRAGNFSYQIGGPWGELAPFTVGASGKDGYGVVRGQLTKAKGDVSAVGATGTGVELGAVGATQFLYGSLHVFSAGTTITVVLESDDNSNFTSATTRATFGPITTAGGTWATRAAGSITDTFYRLRVTAITGTFSIAGAIAIGS